MKRDILHFVGARDFVSFAALHKHFAGDARANTEIALPGNRIIWRGLPQPVIAAVLALLEEGALAAIPGNLAAYRRDGRVLPLPVEKSPAQAPHAQPRWFPVLLRTMETVRAEAAQREAPG